MNAGRTPCRGRQGKRFNPRSNPRGLWTESAREVCTQKKSIRTLQNAFPSLVDTKTRIHRWWWKQFGLLHDPAFSLILRLPRRAADLAVASTLGRPRRSGRPAGAGAAACAGGPASTTQTALLLSEWIEPELHLRQPADDRGNRQGRRDVEPRRQGRQAELASVGPSQRAGPDGSGRAGRRRRRARPRRAGTGPRPVHRAPTVSGRRTDRDEPWPNARKTCVWKLRNGFGVVDENCLPRPEALAMLGAS